MVSSLSNHVNNLAEGIHVIMKSCNHENKCKYRHDNKKYEICKIKYKNYKSTLEDTNLKENVIKCKCLQIFLLRQRVYPYEFMDD